MNTDQGSQFTSTAFIRVLEKHKIQISMDGKGCWRDNVFLERLWKSVKYEEVYLHGYETVSIARKALSQYFDFYNRRRPHSTLDGKTPDMAYFNLTKIVFETINSPSDSGRLRCIHRSGGPVGDAVHAHHALQSNRWSFISGLRV